MREIQKTTPTSSCPKAAHPKHVRVAAYCRVSTDMEEQDSSMQNQEQVYLEKIQAHAGWTLADIYAERRSATSAQTRPEFQRMLADCRAGKIDLILTKSLSRFARNTVDCLSVVRDLQKLNIAVVFEKEKLNTGSRFSEMVLTVLAAFAQEESRSISDNLKWGIRKRYEAGQSRWNRVYGYEKNPDLPKDAEYDCYEQYRIHPIEGAVVRGVFDAFEQGARMSEIASGLNAVGIPTARGGAWSKTSVGILLKQEKYIGDIRLQKTVCVDHLTHRRVKNTGDAVPSYYVRDHHVAIIERKQFERCQRIIGMRNAAQTGCIGYPYAECGLRCPLCGALLHEHGVHTFSHKRAWVCEGAGSCHGYALKEYLLDRALLTAYERLDVTCLDGTAPAAQAVLAMKRCAPVMARVDYYWLDELVEHIGLSPMRDDAMTVTVTWRFGATNRVELLDIKSTDQPSYVAALYDGFLERKAKRKAIRDSQADGAKARQSP